MMDLKRIVLWRQGPLDVEYGLYVEVTKKNIEVIVLSDTIASVYENNVFYTEMPESIMTYKIENREDFYIEEYKNDINIFYGIAGPNFRRIHKLLKENSKANIFLLGERPDLFGNVLELMWRHITRFIFYSAAAIYYKKKITGFISMGKIGVSTYAKYGWPKDKLFPFMYPYKNTVVDKKVYLSNKIKCLYIGRFWNKTKGICLLIDAIQEMNNKSIELDLVGGYGPDAEKVSNKIKNLDNINYIGKWNYDEVSKKMSSYDLVIVPSIYDGWNMIPNQAIDAEIGILVSDGAASDELVKEANNGIVFKKGSKAEIKKALSKVLNDRELLRSWSQNSKDYKKYISNEVVAEYLLDIIDFCINKTGNRPAAPWLNRQN